MSNSLWPHGLQHTRLPYPLLSPTVCSNSYPLNRWCYLSHPLSHPSTFAFSLSRHQGLFQVVGSSHQVASVLELQVQHQVLPVNVQDWFPLGLTGLILLSMGLSRVFSSITVWKHQFFSAQPSLWCSCHICPWLLEKW